MANMTTATVSAAVMTKYKKRAQSFLRKRLYINKIGTQERIDKYSGQVLSTWRPVNLAAQTSSLTEGTAPAEVSITTSTYTATLLQYGAFVKISDLLEVTGRSSMMDLAAKQLGYNAALTLDQLAYTEALNFTAHYANNSTSTTITGADVLTAQELRRLAKKFMANDVNPGDDDLYNIIVHPDQLYDLWSDDKVGGALDVARRSITDNQSEAIWRGEISRLHGFRILQSSQISSTTVNSVTCFRAIAAGPDCMLNVDVESMPFTLFVNPASNINISNPLGQIGSVGWKATYVAKDISDGKRGFVVYSAVSELTV